MDNPKFLLDQAKEAASLCRKVSEIPIVLGGAGYNIFPENALQYLGADMGIRGEGEKAFPRLLERMERRADISDVPELYVKEKGLRKERVFIKVDELAKSSSLCHCERSEAISFVATAIN